MRQKFVLLLTFAVFANVAHVAGGPLAGAVKLYDANEKVGGKSLEQWTAAWWQWALQYKKSENPVTDKTGAFAAAGQPEKVWFLAGNFGGATKRKCVVPADRPILVPVFNYFASQTTKARNEEGRTAFTKEMLAEAKEVIDRGEGLSLEINGKAVGGLDKRRVKTGLFDVEAPGLFDAVHPSFAGKQTGVSDGYWVMLHPLPEGEHTLRIRAKLKAKAGEPAFEMDVSYAITVRAKK